MNMGKEKKEFVVEITNMEEDFSQWYTDIILKADLADYSDVKGCMVIKPYGYAIWENIQKLLDKRFKETGHKNVYLPLLIPESLLNKEKEHVEGFAPEVAWVTHGGSEKLAERLCVRPTSETLFCNMFAKWLNSWRDLPMLYNQWCSVVRWEKNTRPFLRTSEFLWQEGHTIHAAYEESQEETLRMLDIYAEIAEEHMAIPVIKGQKTEKEKFAGAKATYSIESLMHDGKALQTGTSHNFGQNFTKAFDIKFADKDGKLSYAWQTSWGMSTRTIGAIIMVHADNRGLVLPPKIAPIQVVIVPVAQHKEGVLENVKLAAERLKTIGIAVELDDRDAYSVGYKFNDWEMKGVPIRVEIGPKDIEKGQAVFVRRDTGEKIFVQMDRFEEEVKDLLENIQNSLYKKALEHRVEKTSFAANMDEFEEILKTKPGFIKAMWCGDQKCEETIKQNTGATARCMPFEQEELSDSCICCNEKAKKMVYFAKAY